MIISYTLILIGVFVYVSVSRAPDGLKRIDIPLHVIFLAAGANIATSRTLTRRMKAGLIAIVIALTTVIAVWLVTPKIGPLVPVNLVSWVFATSAFTVELALFVGIVMGLDKACGWIARQVRAASLKS